MGNGGRIFVPEAGRNFRLIAERQRQMKRKQAERGREQGEKKAPTALANAGKGGLANPAKRHMGGNAALKRAKDRFEVLFGRAVEIMGRIRPVHRIGDAISAEVKRFAEKYPRDRESQEALRQVLQEAREAGGTKAVVVMAIDRAVMALEDWKFFETGNRGIVR